MKTKYLLIYTAVLLAVGTCSGYAIRKHAEASLTISEVRDTIYIERVSSITTPQVVEERPAGHNVTIYEELLSSRTDSTITAAATEKVYRDTLDNGASYEAVVSGIEPKLEHITISTPSTIITNTITVRKPYEGWLLSATASPIISASPDWQILVPAAIELSYNSGPFHAGLQGGLLIDKPLANTGCTFAPYLGGRITIDLLKLHR